MHHLATAEKQDKMNRERDGAIQQEFERLRPDLFFSDLKSEFSDFRFQKIQTSKFRLGKIQTLSLNFYL